MLLNAAHGQVQKKLKKHKTKEFHYHSPLITMVEYEIGKEFLNRQEANIFSTTFVLKTTVSLFSYFLAMSQFILKM